MAEEEEPHQTPSPPPEEASRKADLSSTIAYYKRGMDKFLSTESISADNKNIRVSEDETLPSIDFTTSRDSLMTLFLSQQWENDFPLPPLEENITPTEIQGTATKDFLQEPLNDIDWMSSMNQGPYEDTPLSQSTKLHNIHKEMSFTMLPGPSQDGNAPLSRHSTTGTSTPWDLARELPPIRTKMDDMFLTHYQLMPPEPTPRDADKVSVADTFSLQDPYPDDDDDEEEEFPDEETVPSPPIVIVPSPPAAPEVPAKKRKRKRKARPKLVPDNKDYVVPTPNDVLLGRGGRSNHHIGNIRYREEVQNQRPLYADLGDDKDAKTRVAEAVVKYVQSYGGRFMEKDNRGWLVVQDMVARHKASQALREDNDPEKRAAKRARFLAKRAAAGQ